MGTSAASDAFIACQDYEMTPREASHTGLSTFASPLTISLEGLGGSTQYDKVTAGFLTTFHDAVVEVSNGGVTVSM